MWKYKRDDKVMIELFLPEWIPNVHPLIIHFPIVLWIIAVLADLMSLLFKKEWLRYSTNTLYFLGAIAALATFLSGEQAIDLVSIPMQGELTASHHSDWGHYTLYFFTAYAVIRFFLFWKQLDRIKVVAVVLFILGAVGVGIVAKTADLGGELVYKYGVGVKR